MFSKNEKAGSIKLYEKKDGIVIVYELKPKDDLIRKYREREMKRIPLKRRCLFTREWVSNPSDMPVLFAHDLYSEVISLSELKGPGRFLNYFTDYNDAEELLNWFYNGNFNGSPVARIETSKK